jgi:hypothetical protein
MNGDELFERSFQVVDGVVDVLAETSAQGATLHLKDIAIYPRTTGSVRLGTKTVLRLRRKLLEEAKKLGFERLHVTGTRLSGATSPRKVDLWFDLTGKDK